MDPLVARLRSRIANRLGLVGLASTALLTGCAEDPAAPRDSHPDPSDDGGLVFTTSGSTQAPRTALNQPPPADFDPVLSTSPPAYVYPLVLTVEGAPPFADVTIDVDGPFRSWSLPATADATGLAQVHTQTSAALVGGTLLDVRAEVEVDGGSVLLDPIQIEIAVPACNYDWVANEGRLDLVTENALLRVCGAIPASGTCDAIDEFHEWQAHDLLVDNLREIVPGNIALDPVCEDVSIVDACCYVLQVDDLNVAPPGGGGGGGWGGYLGRPFTVDGAVRNPLPVPQPGWAADCTLAFADALPRRVRRRLARRWAQQAADEHASVASFARLTLELLSLGAPQDLVADATRAQSDEIRHAADAFTVASALAGAPIGPGRIDTTGATDHRDVRTIFAGAVLEGCLNETICAAWAMRAAQDTTDPHLRPLLERVADDEARHAELSWALVQWLLARYPELADDARQALDAFDLGARPDADPDAALLALGGQLSARQEHDLAVQVLRDAIRPAMDALLGERLAA